jgi:hypothetical protein
VVSQPKAQAKMQSKKPVVERPKKVTEAKFPQEVIFARNRRKVLP